MSKAYQDGGKWWVPWSGEIVPDGAEYLPFHYGGWRPSGNVGASPSSEQYRIPATQEQIAAALRAESPKPAIPESASEAVNTYAPWIEKSWGRTRQVFQAGGVEVWESEGKAGHRTSWHVHPNHRQCLSVASGSLGVRERTGRESLYGEKTGGTTLLAGEAHEIVFPSDCRFIEVYYGIGSVMDTLEEIYR